MSAEAEAALRRYRVMVEYVIEVVPETPRVAPMVRYWSRMLARYVPETDTIWLPTPDHLAYYHGEEIESCGDDHEYLFLHELAHWGTRGEGHTPRMYAFLFALGKIFNYRMMNLRRVELEYKPRSAKRGWRLYLRSFREETT